MCICIWVPRMLEEKRNQWRTLKANGELDKLAQAEDEEEYIFELDKKG